MISMKLRQKGLPAELVKSASQTTPERELEAAHTLAKKKKLGQYGDPGTRLEKRKKHIAAMLRAGFSYDVVKRALG